MHTRINNVHNSITMSISDISSDSDEELRRYYVDTQSSSSSDEVEEESDNEQQTQLHVDVWKLIRNGQKRRVEKDALLMIATACKEFVRYLSSQIRATLEAKDERSKINVHTARTAIEATIGPTDTLKSSDNKYTHRSKYLVALLEKDWDHLKIEPAAHRLLKHTICDVAHILGTASCHKKSVTVYRVQKIWVKLDVQGFRQRWTSL